MSLSYEINRDTLVCYIPTIEVKNFIKDILETIDKIKKENKGFMYKKLKSEIKKLAGDDLI